MKLRSILALFLIVSSAQIHCGLAELTASVQQSVIAAKDQFYTAASIALATAHSSASHAAQGVFTRYITQPKTTVNHLFTTARDAALAKQMQVLSFLMRNKIPLIATGSALAGILVTIAARYGYVALQKFIETTCFNALIEKIALAQDYENNQPYTITVNLTNTQNPITIKEQEKRDYSPYKMLLPQPIDITPIKSSKKSSAQIAYEQIREYVYTGIQTVTEHPTLLLGPVTIAALGTVGAQSKKLAPVAVIGSLGAAYATYQQFTKQFGEKVELNQKTTTILNAIHAIIADARSQKTGLTTHTYSLTFNFNDQTFKFAYEAPYILTHDCLPDTKTALRIAEEIVQKRNEARLIKAYRSSTQQKLSDDEKASVSTRNIPSSLGDARSASNED